MTGCLGDKSALARLHMSAVDAVLSPLIERGLVAICAVTEYELLYSARNTADFQQVRAWIRLAFTWVPVSDKVWQRALDIQGALVEHGQHRCAGLPDILIAATAEHEHLTVLHYDRDFETIAEVTGQPTEWVVPPGTV